MVGCGSALKWRDRISHDRMPRSGADLRCPARPERIGRPMAVDRIVPVGPRSNGRHLMRRTVALFAMATAYSTPSTLRWTVDE